MLLNGRERLGGANKISGCLIREKKSTYGPAGDRAGKGHTSWGKSLGDGTQLLILSSGQEPGLALGI